MHRDGSYERNDNEISFFSFILYLNDGFEGGETEFRKLETIFLKKVPLYCFSIHIGMKAKK
jgi:hypothetical protein